MRPLRRSAKVRIATLAAWLLHHSGAAKLLDRFVASFELRGFGAPGDGFPRILRRRTQTLPILLYHRVNDQDDPYLPSTPIDVFRGHMEIVAERCTVLPLATAVDALRDGELPPDALVITLDDGYRDNFVNAFPILQEFSLTATIFLAVSTVGTGRLLWHDRVSRAIHLARTPTLPGLGNGRESYPLGDIEQRRRAAVEILYQLRAVSDDERESRVARLIEAAGCDDADDSDLMLNWDEVREMRRQGISFGAHTMTHVVLSMVSPERARAEIVQSKETIEARLGEPVRAFAYPSGRHGDFDAGTKEIVRQAGFSCAVTTVSGVNQHRAGRTVPDLLELERGGSWETNPPLFALRLSLARLLT